MNELRSPLVRGGLELSCIVFVSMPPTVLNENLISRYKSLVTSLHVEPPKEAKVGSFECEKQTGFSIDSTTKTKVQTKLKRKSQETSASGGKNKPTKEKLPQSKDIRVFFANMEKSDDKTSKKETSKNFVIDLTD